MSNPHQDERFMVGLAHEFEITVRAAGLTNHHLDMLAKDVGKCQLVRQFLDGNARIEIIQHIVDTDAQPPLPGKDWGVEKHVRHGKIIIDPAKLILHLEPEQKAGGVLKGYVLSERLTGRPDALGIHELDYLYEHQDLIPESWKEMWAVYGWNTILRDPRGYLCVPYLYWSGGRWYRSYHWLGYQWSAKDPAGLLAS